MCCVRVCVCCVSNLRIYSFQKHTHTHTLTTADQYGCCAVFASELGTSEGRSTSHQYKPASHWYVLHIIHTVRTHSMMHILYILHIGTVCTVVLCVYYFVPYFSYIVCVCVCVCVCVLHVKR